MEDPDEERALRALGTALDANAPVIRHRLRRFPEGTPFLRLRLPGASDAALFLDGRQWIYLSEPGRGAPVTEFAAGQLDDDPEVVVERLMSVMGRSQGRTWRPGRLLRALAFGFGAAALVCVLSGLIMAVLVGGSGYVSEASTRGVYVLAVLFGLIAGVWVGIRRWRRLP
ncbi:hypothetical protein [Streptosporangium sp. NPDC049376]|uniref:hypothetical protein n=1 Tax=Streptosporangium sp. NPDC049376 TaxID=3366192 RepID=UPI00379B5AF5